jgi:AraC-like DNA-binding protein
VIRRNMADERKLVQMIEQQRRLPKQVFTLMCEMLDHGYTQGDLARLTGMSRQSISERLKHHGRPPQPRKRQLVP